MQKGGCFRLALKAQWSTRISPDVRLFSRQSTATNLPTRYGTLTCSSALLSTSKSRNSHGQAVADHVSICSIRICPAFFLSTVLNGHVRLAATHVSPVLSYCTPVQHR